MSTELSHLMRLAGVNPDLHAGIADAQPSPSVYGQKLKRDQVGTMPMDLDQEIEALLGPSQVMSEQAQKVLNMIDKLSPFLSQIVPTLEYGEQLAVKAKLTSMASSI